MNCNNCNHTSDIHNTSDLGMSILKLGKCMIPGCQCKEYVDSIRSIDEELL